MAWHFQQGKGHSRGTWRLVDSCGVQVWLHHTITRPSIDTGRCAESGEAAAPGPHWWVATDGADPRVSAASSLVLIHVISLRLFNAVPLSFARAKLSAGTQIASFCVPAGLCTSA